MKIAIIREILAMISSGQNESLTLIKIIGCLGISMLIILFDAPIVLFLLSAPTKNIKNTTVIRTILHCESISQKPSTLFHTLNCRINSTLLVFLGNSTIISLSILHNTNC